MALVDDMASLGAEIQNGWDARVAAVADMRADSAQTLRDIHEAHAAMAKDQNERLKADASARRSDVATQLSDQAKAHAAMAKDQRARMGEDRAQLAADAAAGHKERGIARQETQTAIAMAQKSWASTTAAMAKRRGLRDT